MIPKMVQLEGGPADGLWLSVDDTPAIDVQIGDPGVPLILGHAVYRRDGETGRYVFAMMRPRLPNPGRRVFGNRR